MPDSRTDGAASLSTDATLPPEKAAADPLARGSASRTDGTASLSTDATLPPENAWWVGRAADPLSAFPGLAPPQAAGELGRLAGYRVLKVLGQGGMGIVFHGEDVQLSRSVALKMMLPELAASPDARERFLRESRAQAQIEHDHIVPIYQVGEANGVPFLAMPLLKGLSLADYLNKGKPLSLAQIVRIGRDVARGLQAAHERGLIHRDIKPANLWLDASAGGRVKILDFGLARPQQTANELTASGVMVGTPAYMPPEQIDGKAELRSDLYSLGVVLYRLLAGRLPFDQPDMLPLLTAVATEPPPPLRALAPNVPVALAGLVMRLLQKKPEDRPGSAREVFDALRVVDQESASVTAPMTAPADLERAGPPRKQPAAMRPAPRQQGGRPQGPVLLVPVPPAPPRKLKLAPRRLWPLRLVVGSLLGLLATIAVVILVLPPGGSEQQSTKLEKPDQDKTEASPAAKADADKKEDSSRAPSARLPSEDKDTDKDKKKDDKVLIPPLAEEKALKDPKVWDMEQLEKHFVIQQRSYDPEKDTISIMVLTKKAWTAAEVNADAGRWITYIFVPQQALVIFYNKEEVECGRATVFNGLSRTSAKLTDKEEKMGLRRFLIKINLTLAKVGKNAVSAKFVYPEPK